MIRCATRQQDCSLTFVLFSIREFMVNVHIVEEPESRYKKIQAVVHRLLHLTRSRSPLNLETGHTRPCKLHLHATQGDLQEPSTLWTVLPVRSLTCVRSGLLRQRQQYCDTGDHTARKRILNESTIRRMLRLSMSEKYIRSKCWTCASRGLCGPVCRWPNYSNRHRPFGSA